MQEDESENYKAADTNGDGLTYANELLALICREAHTGTLNVTVKHSMRFADADKNGKLSLEEFQNAGFANKVPWLPLTGAVRVARVQMSEEDEDF